MGAFDLNAPRRLANCKGDISFCDENPPIYIFPAENCVVLNVLTIGLETMSANVNYVLKLVLQFENRSVLISYGVY